MRVGEHEIGEDVLQGALNEASLFGRSFDAHELRVAIARRLVGNPLCPKGWGIEWELGNRLVQREKKAGRLKFKGRRWHRVLPEGGA